MSLTYPATNNKQAIDLNIDSANRWRQILTGDINTTVETFEGGGNVPSVAKAIADLAAYKSPIAWNEGSNETDILQPRTFNNFVFVPIRVPAPMDAIPNDFYWKAYLQSVDDISPDTGYNVYIETISGADKDTFDLPWQYDSVEGNLFVWVNGTKLTQDSLTFVDDDTVTISPAATDGQIVEIASFTLAAYSIVLGLKDEARQAATDAELAAAKLSSNIHEETLNIGTEYVDLPFYVDAAIRNFFVVLDGITQSNGSITPVNSSDIEITTGPCNRLKLGGPIEQEMDIMVISSLSTALGDVADAIAEYTSGVKATVDTIADLRNLTPLPGASVDVLGYYERGDGGGGPKRIWMEGQSAGTYIDNGGSIILPTNGDGSAAWLIDTELCAPDIRWFGASSTETAENNTTSINNALAASSSGIVSVNDGEFLTNYTSVTSPNFVGCGTIVTDSGAHKRAKTSILISSQPASLTNGNGILDDFDQDFSYNQASKQIIVTGTDTIGQPTTGYSQPNAVCPDYTRVFYQSGHNQASGSLEGRTGWAAKRINVTHNGSGDAACYNSNMTITNNDGFASLLGEPAANIMSGQINAGTNDVVLNMIEMNHVDNGYDVISKGPVFNYNRTNNTAAKGQFWTGTRQQSIGTVACDSAFQPVGNWNNGFDSTCMSTSVRAVSLAETHRVTFDAIPQNLPGVPGFKTWGTGGSTYIAKETDLIFKYEGDLILALDANSVISYKQHLFNNGLRPVTDGVGSVGNASFRFDTIYAVNGTINTSDENEKEQIEDIPATWIEAAKNIKPKRFKFKDAVSEKGESARWHIGYIAQQVFQALSDAGVEDPWECGFLCRDMLGEADEDSNMIPLIDETTGLQKERWGLRYSELLALKLAALEIP